MFVRFEPFSFRSVPASNLFDLERTVDGLFSRFLGDRPAGQSTEFPLIHVTENADATIVSAELPGVKKEDVKITLDEGVLTISGERKATARAEEAKTLRDEIWTGSFSRSLELPHAVRENQLSAELSDGILTVTLPKAEEARPREIKVQ